MFYCYNYKNELIEIRDNLFDAECITDCGETGYVLTPWKLGVCAGRHEMPVDGYVVDNIDDPADFTEIRQKVDEGMREYYCKGNTPHVLDLYVTGLTVVLVEILNWCRQHSIGVTLWHYDAKTGQYFGQNVV